MHCTTLADMAATLSVHGPAMIASQQVIPASAVTCYWASSRSRLELWHQTIARYKFAERAGKTELMRRWWSRHRVVLEEVVVSEALTRVVASIATAMERVTNRDEVSPVTHAVYCSHLEASNRVHELVLSGQGKSVQDVVRMNRLRKGVERWTDALLGRISFRVADCTHYSFDVARAKEFAEEMREQGDGVARSIRCGMMNAALHDMIANRSSPEPGLPQANQNVADAVMLLFQHELFDDLGLMKSAWMHRITPNGASECPPSREPRRPTSTFFDFAENPPEVDPKADDIQRWAP